MLELEQQRVRQQGLMGTLADGGQKVRGPH